VVVRRKKVEYHITSEARKETYIVEQNKDHLKCARECGILCPQCKICRRAFICSCPERTLKGFICKHIHAVCINENEMEPKENATSMPALFETISTNSPTTRLSCVFSTESFHVYFTATFRARNCYNFSMTNQT